MIAGMSTVFAVSTILTIMGSAITVGMVVATSKMRDSDLKDTIDFISKFTAGAFAVATLSLAITGFPVMIDYIASMQ